MTPIWVSHIRSMKAFRDTETSIQWQADRVNKTWVHTDILQITQTQSDATVMKRLNMGPTGLQGQASDDERSNASLYFKLTANMASFRCWYMLTYSEFAPEQFAGILSTDKQMSLQATSRIKETAELLLDAEAALADPTHPDRLAP